MAKDRFLVEVNGETKVEAGACVGAAVEVGEGKSVGTGDAAAFTTVETSLA